MTDLQMMRFHDVEEFAAEMRGRGWDGAVRQTAPGAFGVELTLRQLDCVIVARTRHSVANMREVVTPADARTFGLVAPQSTTNSWCHRPFDRVILQMMPRCDYAASNGAGHLGYQMAFTDTRIAEVCDQLELPGALHDGEALQPLDDAIGRGAARAVNALLDHGSSEPLEQVADDLLVMFLSRFSGLPAARRPRASQRRLAFRRARDYMHAHLDDAITLADVARHAGASRRSITAGFQEATGVSPMAYLKLVRLNRVHRALRRHRGKRVQIVDLANASGFWHMGQFASDYRKLFGELPSATLRIPAPASDGAQANQPSRSSKSREPGRNTSSIVS